MYIFKYIKSRLPSSPPSQSCQNLSIKTYSIYSNLSNFHSPPPPPNIETPYMYTRINIVTIKKSKACMNLKENKFLVMNDKLRLQRLI